MNLQIQRNGTWQKVSKQEFLELVSAGVVRPDTAVLLNDQQTVASRLKGLVFPSNVAVPPPPPYLPQAARPVPVPHAAPKQSFCSNCGNVVSEQAAACMSCGAKPTGHKKFCRQCGVPLNPEQVVCIKCGAGLVGTSAIGGALATNVMSAFQTTNVPLAPVQRKDRITFWTMLLTVSYGLCFFAAIAYLLLAASVPVSDHVETGGVTGFYFIVVVPTCTAYMCCYCIWLRRLWEEVPQRFARTSSINAVMLSLIPYYSWYWNFTAFYGLCGDMNKATESYGLGSCFDGTWIKMVCTWWVISGVLGHVPPITDDPFIANITCGFLILLSIACAAITLPTCWYLRKNVLAFIDIKASVGEP